MCFYGLAYRQVLLLLLQALRPPIARDDLKWGAPGQVSHKADDGGPVWRIRVQLRFALPTSSSLSGPEDMALGMGFHSAFSVTWGQATAQRRGVGWLLHKE